MTLAKRAEQRLGPRSERDTDGLELHPQDMRPPVLVLVQDQSIGVTPGKIQRTDTQEEFDSLDVVPIFVRPSRILWPAGGFSRDAVPLCWSDDGHMGSSRLLDGSQARWSGAPCSECQEYTARPWEREEKDKCQPGYNVVLVDAESYGGYVIRLRGTAAKLAQFFVAKGIARRAVVRLYSERVEKTTGKWYQLKAKTLRLLDEADQSLIQDILQDYRDAVVQEMDQVEMEAQKPAEAAPHSAQRGEVPSLAQHALLPGDQSPVTKGGIKEHMADMNDLFGPGG